MQCLNSANVTPPQQWKARVLYSTKLRQQCKQVTHSYCKRRRYRCRTSLRYMAMEHVTKLSALPFTGVADRGWAGRQEGCRTGAQWRSADAAACHSLFEFCQYVSEGFLCT
mmetsp:Transcript_60139/g.97423  ORF Transcript_60139/g.97423 Transcript_60139/m.97423 type:complete len:111 (+) Transcript_60139:292-624(+)